ncbi:MAG: leucyl aminopeptidase family protein [Pseudomonadota bacterium]
MTALIPITRGELAGWLDRLEGAEANWVRQTGFEARAGQICFMPEPDGSLARVVCGVGDEYSLWSLGGLSRDLPPGEYQLEADWEDPATPLLALGLRLGAYRFDRYVDHQESTFTLVVPEPHGEEIDRLVVATELVRDLVTTPAEHMGPLELAQATTAVAEAGQAQVRVVEGEALLEQNFPAVHVVGRAAAVAPRLIEMDWGEEDHPLVALIGKGVCFDTGGLDLKNAAGMGLMKKDMGGAAHVLGLAQLVMAAELPVRLKVLIPAVENSVAGNAYRPGDVIATRKGLSVEIGNTDAEGRLVMSDALVLACENEPDIVIDFATLTGAARVAMGPDVPPFFCNDEALAEDLMLASEAASDPLWRLPLYAPYRDMLKSPIADLNNIGNTGMGGCITAALFLEHFVEPSTPWIHVDTYAWNASDRPGRPKGGEALGLRAMFELLRARYS